jgi:carboxyl-terminal processing protease
VRRLRFIALALAGLLLLGGHAAAEPRVALVIGNSSYGGDLGQLPNPANDARLMAQTLKGIGFEVIEAEDADLPAMKRKIQDFGARLATAGGGATGLFFYAGHGLQVAGTNYLIPIHAKIAREPDVEFEAVSVDLVMKQMAFAESAVNIVILDACRNNPLSRGFRAVTRGLADPAVRPMGSFIAYSTAPGDVAEDGQGGNSPYTTALAAAITRPGASINDVFQEVRGRVLEATGKKQVPWDASSLTAPFYFVPAATPVAPAAGNAADAQAIELAFWNSVKDSKSPEDYQAYLKAFPDGVFAPLAQLRAGRPGEAAERVMNVDPDPVTPEHAGDVAVETAFWAAVEDDRTVDGYQVYLRRYPNGAYVAIAKRRLAELAGATQAPPSTVQPQAELAPPPQAKGPLPEIVAATATLYARAKARLREAPAADAPIITRLAAGAPLQVTGRSADGAWWRVTSADGKAGFVAAVAVTDQAPVAIPAGQALDICLKGTDRPAAERAAACRQALAAGIADDADRYNAELWLGDALFALGQNEAAMEAYRAAVDIDPNFFSAYNGIGAIHLSAGRYAEARRAFDKALSLEPGDSDSIYQRGSALGYLGEFEAARADLRRAIALKPDEPTYRDELGMVDLAMGDLDAASADVEGAVAIDPSYWSVSAMAVSYLLGKPERTIAMAEAGMKSQPTYQYFYIWKALALRARGDAAGAKVTLTDGAKAIGNQDWPLPVIDFLAGQISESQLRGLAASSNPKVQSERTCEIDYYVGEVAYLAGDRSAASLAFQAAVNSRVYHYLEYAAGQARLVQLKD